MRTKIKDERVLQVNNKILSEAYLIVLFLLAASVFIKAYVLDMHFTQYGAELGILLVSMVYIGIRSAIAGHDLLNTSKKGKILTILMVLISSLGVAVIQGVKNYSNYGHLYTGLSDPLFIAAVGITFISSLILISGAVVFVYYLNRKGQQRLEKQLNDDED